VKEIYGKTVYDSDDEILHPRHTALVVVDLQNDFAHPDGHFARNGVDVAPIERILPRVVELVDAAREHGALVVWLQNTILPGGLSDSPSWLAFRSRHGFGLESTIEGTWGHDFVEPLRPAPTEPVVRKHRSSGFVNTDLDALLRANRIETVVCCGCFTEGCVESTVREAAFHDYYAVVVEDATATNSPERHDASIAVMRSQFLVRPAADVVRAWAAARVPV
jgi:ureidoacrylate peracid hydrolase